MLTVHHLDHSQSFRIVWLLEELKAHGNNVDYNLKLYQRNASDRLAPPEYKALSPLGTAPTITTDSGLIMNESNAIIEFILDMANDDKLRPIASSPNRESYLVWFHAVQGSMQPMLTVDVVFRQAAKKAPFPISSIVKLIGGKARDAIVFPRLNKLLKLAEQQLSKHEYLAAPELTAADITAIYPFASAFSRYPQYDQTYPNTKAWLDRVVARPAYKAAQVKVGEHGSIVFEE